MSAFLCVKCMREGADPIVRYSQDRYIIEVAAKSADSHDRAKQVGTYRMCKRHAVAHIEHVAATWERTNP